MIVVGLVVEANENSYHRELHQERAEDGNERWAQSTLDLLEYGDQHVLWLVSPWLDVAIVGVFLCTWYEFTNNW